MKKRYCLLFASSVLLSSSAAHAEASRQVILSVGASNQSFDGVAGSLNDKQYSNTAVSGKKRDTAWKVSYQQPMKGNTSLNIGYVELGSNNAEIITGPPAGKTDQAVAKDIAESLPIRGEGVVASMLYHMPLASAVDANFGLGAYIYRDERTAGFRNAIETAKKSSGALMSHAGINYKVTPQISIQGEWEHYFMPGEDVDYIGLGMAYSF